MNQSWQMLSMCTVQVQPDLRGRTVAGTGADAMRRQISAERCHLLSASDEPVKSVASCACDVAALLRTCEHGRWDDPVVAVCRHTRTGSSWSWTGRRSCGRSPAWSGS